MSPMKFTGLYPGDTKPNGHIAVVLFDDNQINPAIAYLFPTTNSYYKSELRRSPVFAARLGLNQAQKLKASMKELSLFFEVAGQWFRVFGQDQYVT